MLSLGVSLGIKGSEQPSESLRSGESSSTETSKGLQSVMLTVLHCISHSSAQALEPQRLCYFSVIVDQRVPVSLLENGPSSLIKL